MDVEVCLENRITDKRVEGEGVGADDDAEVRVANSKSEATVEPEFDQGHHRVGLAAFGDETPHQVRTLTSRTAMRRNECGDGGAVEGGDEDLDVLGVCLNMSLG